MGVALWVISGHVPHQGLGGHVSMWRCGYIQFWQCLRNVFFSRNLGQREREREWMEAHIASGPKFRGTRTL